MSEKKSRGGAPKGKASVARRDPEATRQALLAAAIAEFAEHGLAGGRIDNIAGRAGVNKQMVYYHFGNKDDLYAAALERVYLDIREREQGLNLQDLQPQEAMERLIEFSFDYLAEHPEFIALVNDENRMHARHLRSSALVAPMHSPLVRLVEGVLARGVEAGIFNDRLSPIDLYLSIASLAFFYFSNRGTLSAIFTKDMSGPEHFAQRRQHAVDLVLLALRPPESFNQLVDTP